MLVGYVLAGGHSRRFGRDKAHVVVDGRQAVLRQVSLLTAVCDGPVTVVGTEIDDGFSGVDAIGDAGGRQGPLDGLVSALDHASTCAAQLAAVVAVDLWSLTPEVLDRLVERYDEQADDVVHLRGAESRRDQPLCAVWNVAACRPILEAAFDSGERSVLRAWTDLRRRAVDVDDSFLANINTQEEFAQWTADRSTRDGDGSVS